MKNTISIKEFFTGRAPKVSGKVEYTAQNRFDYHDYYVPNVLGRMKITFRLILEINKFLCIPKVLNKFYQLSLVRNETFELTIINTLVNLHKMIPTKIDSLDIPNKTDPVDSVKRLSDSTFEITLKDGLVLHDWEGTQKFEALYWLMRDKDNNNYTSQTYFAGSAVNRSLINSTNRFPGDKYIPKGNVVVVEAGAYVGYKALGYARHIGPSGRILAIEASPDNYSLIKYNCENNKLGSNIIVRCCAIWNKDCELPLQSNRRMQHTIAEVDDLNYDSSQTITARSLDSLFEEEGLEKIDYLNLQLNGAEIEALEGLNIYFNRVRYINIITRYKRNGELVVDIAKRMLEEKGCQIIVDWRSDGLYNLTAQVVTD